MTPKVKKITTHYKFMCGCECYISVKSMHISLLTWRDCHLKHLKDRSHNAQNISSSELLGRLFETVMFIINIWVSVTTGSVSVLFIWWYQTRCWKSASHSKHIMILLYNNGMSHLDIIANNIIFYARVIM